MQGWSLTEADGQRRLSLEGGRSLPLFGEAGPAFEQELVQLIGGSDRVRYSTFSADTKSLRPVERSILEAPANKDFKLFYGTSKMKSDDKEVPSPSAEARANPRAYVYQANQNYVVHGDRSYPIQGGSYFHDKLAVFERDGQKIAIQLTANATDSGFGHAERKDRVSQRNTYMVFTDPKQVAAVDQYLAWKFNENPSAGDRPAPMPGFATSGPNTNLLAQYGGQINRMLDAGDMVVETANVDSTLGQVFSDALRKHPGRSIVFQVNAIDELGKPADDRVAKMSRAIQALSDANPGQVHMRTLQSVVPSFLPGREHLQKALNYVTGQKFHHANIMAARNTNETIHGSMRFKTSFVVPDARYGAVTDVAFMGQSPELAQAYGSQAELTFFERIKGAVSRAIYTAKPFAPVREYQTNRPYATGYMQKSGDTVRIPMPSGIELLTPSDRSDVNFQLLLTTKQFKDVSNHTYSMLRWARDKAKTDPGYGELAAQLEHDMHISDTQGSSFFQNYLSGLANLYQVRTPTGLEGGHYEAGGAIKQLDAALGRRTWGMSFDFMPMQMGSLGLPGTLMASLGRGTDSWMRFTPGVSEFEPNREEGPFEKLATIINSTLTNAVVLAGIFRLVALPVLHMTHRTREGTHTRFANAASMPELPGTAPAHQRLGNVLTRAGGQIGWTLTESSSLFLNEMFAHTTKNVLGRVASLYDRIFPQAGAVDLVRNMANQFAAGSNINNSFSSNLVEVTRHWNNWVQNRFVLSTITHTEHGVMGWLEPFVKNDRYKGLARALFFPVMLPADMARHGVVSGAQHFGRSLRDTFVTGTKEMVYHMDPATGAPKGRWFRAGVIAYAVAETLTAIAGSMSPASVFTQILGTRAAQQDQLMLTQDERGRARQARLMMEKSAGQLSIARELGENFVTTGTDMAISLAFYPISSVIAAGYNKAEQTPVLAPAMYAAGAMVATGVVRPRARMRTFALAAAAGAAFGFRDYRFANLFPQKSRYVYAGYTTEAHAAVSHQAQILNDVADILAKGQGEGAVREHLQQNLANLNGEELNKLVTEIQHTQSTLGVGGIRRMANELGMRGMYQLASPLQRELSGREMFAVSMQVPLPVPFIATQTVTRLHIGNELHYSTTLQGPVNIQLGSGHKMPVFYTKTNQPAKPGVEAAYSTAGAFGIATSMTLMLGFRTPFALLVGALAGASVGYGRYREVKAANEEAVDSKRIYGYAAQYEPGNFLETLLMPLLALKGFQVLTQVGTTVWDWAGGRGSGARFQTSVNRGYSFMTAAVRGNGAFPIAIGQFLLQAPRAIVRELLLSQLEGVDPRGQQLARFEARRIIRETPLARERVERLRAFFASNGVTTTAGAATLTGSRRNERIGGILEWFYRFQEPSWDALTTAQERVTTTDTGGHGAHFYENTLYGRANGLPVGSTAAPATRTLSGRVATGLSRGFGALAVTYFIGAPVVAGFANYFGRREGGMQGLTDKAVGFFSFNSYLHSAARFFATQVLGINMPTSNEDSPMRLRNEPDMLYEMRSNAYKNAHSGDPLSILMNQRAYELGVLFGGFYHAIASSLFYGPSFGAPTKHDVGGKTYTIINQSEQHQEGLSVHFAQFNIMSWFMAGVNQMSLAQGQQGVGTTVKDLEATRRVTATARRGNPMTTAKRFVRGPAMRLSVGSLYNEQMGLDQLTPAGQAELARRRSMMAFFLADGDSARVLRYFSSKGTADESAMDLHMPQWATRFDKRRQDDNFYFFGLGNFKQFTEQLRSHTRAKAYGATGELDEFDYQFMGEGSAMMKPTGNTLDDLISQDGGKSNLPETLTVFSAALLALSAGGLYLSRNLRQMSVGGLRTPLPEFLQRSITPMSDTPLYHQAYFWDPDQRAMSVAPTNPGAAAAAASPSRYRDFWRANMASQRAWTYRIGQSFYTFGGADLHLMNPTQHSGTRTLVNPATGATTTFNLTSLTPASALDQEFFRQMTVLSYENDVTRRLNVARYTAGSSVFGRIRGTSHSLTDLIENRLRGMDQLRQTAEDIRTHALTRQAEIAAARGSLGGSNPVLDGYDRSYASRVATTTDIINRFDVAPTNASGARIGLSVRERMENLRTVQTAMRQFVAADAASGSPMTEAQMRGRMAGMTVDELLSHPSVPGTGTLHALPGPTDAQRGLSVADFLRNQLQSLHDDVLDIRSNAGRSAAPSGGIVERMGYIGMHATNAYKYVVALSGGNRQVFANGIFDAIARSLAGGFAGLDGGAFYSLYETTSRAGRLTTTLVNATLGRGSTGAATAFGAVEHAAMGHLAHAGLDPNDQASLEAFARRLHEVHGQAGGPALTPETDLSGAVQRLKTAIEGLNERDFGVRSSATVTADKGRLISRTVAQTFNPLRAMALAADHAPSGLFQAFGLYPLLSTTAYAGVSLRALAAVDKERDDFSNTMAGQVALQYRNYPQQLVSAEAIGATVSQTAEHLTLNWLDRSGRSAQLGAIFTPPAAGRPQLARSTAGIHQAIAVYSGYAVGAGFGFIAGSGDREVAHYYGQQGAATALGLTSGAQALAVGGTAAALAMTIFSGGGAAAAAGFGTLALGFGAGMLASKFGFGLTASFAISGAVMGLQHGGVWGALGGAVVGAGLGYVADNYLLKSDNTENLPLAAKLAKSAETGTGRFFLFGTTMLPRVMNAVSTWGMEQFRPARNADEVAAERRNSTVGLGLLGLVGGAAAAGTFGALPLAALGVGVAAGAVGSVLGYNYSKGIKAFFRGLFQSVSYNEATFAPDVHQLYEPGQFTGIMSPSSNPSIWRMPTPGAPPGSGYHFARMSPVFVGHTVDAVYEQYNMQRQLAASDNSMALLNHLLPREVLENQADFPTDTHMSSPVSPYGESYAMFKSLATSGPGMQAMLAERAVALQRAYAQLEAAKGTHWGYKDKDGNFQASLPSVRVAPDEVARRAGLGDPELRHDARFGNPRTGAIPGAYAVRPLMRKGNIAQLGDDPETRHVPMSEEEIKARGDVVVVGGIARMFSSGTVMTSGYGMRFHPIHGKDTMHLGIDLVPKPVKGPKPADWDSIRAVGAGTVTAAGWEGGLGYTVRFQTKVGDDSYLVSTSHMKPGLAVKVGDMVQPGQLLGVMGSTGYATGPHVHAVVKKLVRGTWVHMNPRESPFFNQASQEMLANAPVRLFPNISSGDATPAQARLADSNPQYDALLQNAASKYRMDWRLLKAIMLVESSGNPKTLGKLDEVGLMQLRPQTAEWMGGRIQGPLRGPQDWRYDPRRNIEAGARYLDWLTKLAEKRGGKYATRDLAIAAYNAGHYATGLEDKKDASGKVTKRYPRITNPEYVENVRGLHNYLLQHYDEQGRPKQPKPAAKPNQHSAAAHKELLAQTPMLTSEVARQRRLIAGSSEASRLRQMAVAVKARVMVGPQQAAAPNSLVDHAKPRPPKPSQVAVRVEENMLEVSYQVVDGWLPDCLIDTTKAPSRSQAPDPFIHEYQARGHCA